MGNFAAWPRSYRTTAQHHGLLCGGPAREAGGRGLGEYVSVGDRPRTGRDGRVVQRISTTASSVPRFVSSGERTRARETRQREVKDGQAQRFGRTVRSHYRRQEERGRRGLGPCGHRQGQRTAARCGGGGAAAS